MRVTSTNQAEALRAGVLPDLEEIRSGLFAIPLDMPGMQPPYALVYAALAPSGAVDLVDSGLAGDDSWAALTEALERIGSGITAVRSVTITHLHRDHTGLAARIRAASGAVVQMHALEAHAVEAGARFGNEHDPEALCDRWGVPAAKRPELMATARAHAAQHGPGTGAGDQSAEAGERSVGSGSLGPIRRIADGERIELGRFAATAIHTPGHTAGHLCLVVPDEGLVFTGDHVLPVINPGIALGGAQGADPLGEYYDSLDRIARYGDAETLPGHGFRFAGVAERCAEIRAHHEARSREIAEIRAADPHLTVWETASRVTWSGGWEQLAGVSLFSALSQTELHIARLAATAG